MPRMTDPSFVESGFSRTTSQDWIASPFEKEGFDMKFLCLGYFDREAMDALPKAEVDALMEQCTPYMDVFHKTGQVLVDAGLDIQAKSLRRRKGKLAVTDGPYVETKEMVGGSFLIEARDMEDAIRV